MKMNKKTSVLVILTLMVSVIVSSSVFAYQDGDREVKYYNYNLNISDEDGIIGERYDPTLRRFNRNWVVSINQVSNTNYPIEYCVLKGVGAPEQVANSAYKKGQGNTGNTYYNSNSVGEYVWLNAYVDFRESSNGKYSRGQWSPDNNR